MRAMVDVDCKDTHEHDDPRSERERPCCPITGAADGSSSHSRDGDDAISAVAGPGTVEHQQRLTAVVRNEQGRSSSAPPPATVAVVGAEGVPSFLSGTPSWSFAHQLMSSLFGDQQQQAHQQRRVGEGGHAVIASAVTDVATPTTSSSSSTMATGTTTATSSTYYTTPTLGILTQQLIHPISSVAPSSSPTPSASLTTPILQRSGSSDGGRYRERSDDILGTDDDTNIKDYPRGIGNNNCDSNNSKATNVITLTRTHFSSPESRQTNYHPLQDDDEYVYYEPYHQQEQQHDDIHHGPMGHFETLTAKDDTATTGGKSGGEDNTTLGSSDLFLRHAYPLTLQRSASSAFGCPHTSTSSSSSSFCNFKTRARVRTLSNSGYSDPGASAFRPVWNKSSSADVGSDVGSTISSSISGAVAATTHSDPLSDRTQARAFYSPWRRVMSRMKKGNYNSNTNNSSCEKGNFGGGRKLRRRLSGRENPNAAGLDGGDDDLDGGVLGGVIASLSEVRVEGSLPTSFAGSDFKEATAAKEKNTATFLASFKSSSVQAYLDDDEVRDVEVVDSKGKSFASLAAYHPEVHYDDPGVALDLSDDSDNDDDEDVPQFLGVTNHTNVKMADNKSFVSVTRTNPKRNTKEEPSPPVFDHIPCDSVEVTTMLVSESILGSVRIIASDSIDENSPPTVERVVVCENADNFPYHPLSDSDGEDNYETEKGDEFNVEDLQGDANLQSAGCRHLARLKYRSPQRAPRPVQPTSSSSRGKSGFIIGQQLSPSPSQDSPDSRYSSLGGSPESRISCSNSRSVSSTMNSSGDRTCITEGSLVADNEVRNANRRHSSGRTGGVGSGGEIGSDNNQEVVVGPDGSETVVSSSTASSTAWPHLSSPRTLRDGATMPVERFFAGGNVNMSPSSMGTIVHPDDIIGGRDIKDHALPSGRSSSAPIVSKLLIPKKLSKKSSGGTVGSVRESTHSPHTVSSVSANSSSSSETKKPLKFVAYEFHEERESPFDEPPVSGYDTVRGEKGVTSGVPSKTDTYLALIKPRISTLGGSITSHRPPIVQRPSATVPVKPPQSPRRTALLHGRARTPTRTPPPSSLSTNIVPRSGSSTPSSPPVIIDGPSNAGTLWIPHHRAIPPRPGTAAFPMSSQLHADKLIVSDAPSVGNDEVEDLVRNELTSAPSTTMGVVVSPEKLQETTRRLHLISPKPKLNATQSLKLGEIVMVSPEKGDK